MILLKTDLNKNSLVWWSTMCIFKAASVVHFSEQ